MQNLAIGTKISQYLITSKLSLIEKQYIFKLKCRIEHVKNNYKSMYLNDLNCVFCKDKNSVDSVKHYLETCSYFETNINFQAKVMHISYADIFGDVNAQIRIVKLWLQIEEERKMFC